MKHTMEEDFQHFLSYSGLRNSTDDEVRKMRIAFDASWVSSEDEQGDPPCYHEKTEDRGTYFLCKNCGHVMQ